MTTQETAAEQGSLLLGIAFGFLEGGNSYMFFFFLGISMTILKEHHIQFITNEKDIKGNR